MQSKPLLQKIFSNPLIKIFDYRQVFSEFVVFATFVHQFRGRRWRLPTNLVAFCQFGNISQGLQTPKIAAFNLKH